MANMINSRQAKGMSQSALARALAEEGLAFHQPTIQRIESGERPVRINEAVVIVRLLQMGEPGTLGLDSAIQAADGAQAASVLLGALNHARASRRELRHWRDEALERVKRDLAYLESMLGHYRNLIVALDESPEAELVKWAEDELSVQQAILSELGIRYGEHPEEA